MYGYTPTADVSEVGEPLLVASFFAWSKLVTHASMPVALLLMAQSTRSQVKGFGMSVAALASTAPER